MTVRRLPIVQWTRSDGVPTIAHELVRLEDGRERTRCGCRVPLRPGAKARRGVGAVECGRCLHFRAVDEGRAKTWRPAAGRITAQMVEQARQNFTRAGGRIRKIGAR